MPPGDARPGDTRRPPNVLLAVGAAFMLLRAGLTTWDGLHAPRTVITTAPDRRIAAPAGDAMSWVPAEAAVEQSQRAGRPVLYEFSAAWCGPCESVRRDVFANPEHARAVQSAVIPVHVVDRQREDGRNPATVDSLQQAFGVDAFPTLVVWSPASGRHETTSGYDGSADHLVKWIADAARRVR